jgi:CTP:molybdopterin cytidylyltransferase MocA
MSENSWSSAAVVLAAGSGSRFGGHKLIATFAGRPLLQRGIDAVCASGVLSCVLVVGSDADAVLNNVDVRRCAVVFNDEWRQGIASSIRAGLAYADEADACVFVLADQPYVCSADIDALLRRGADGGAPIVALRAERIWGAPVLFPRADFAGLMRLGGDTGAKRYAQSHMRRVHFVKARDGRAFCDVDTLSDIRALRA